MISRESILDGAIARMIMSGGMGSMLLSDEERNASLRQVLTETDGRDVWVFAYGSLIWNPAFHFVERRPGTIRGYHRRFCLWAPLGRGTPERPGLMLGLDHGGACRGIAFRIAAEAAATELDVIWRREMVTGAYVPRWTRVTTETDDLSAIAFVINRRHPRYAGRLAETEVVRVLRTAAGAFGSCAEYLYQTIDHLNAAGLDDPQLRRLRRAVEERLAGPPVAAAGWPAR